MIHVHIQLLYIHEVHEKEGHCAFTGYVEKMVQISVIKSTT